MTTTAVAPTTTTPPTTPTTNTNSTSSASATQLSLNNGLASLATNFQSFLTLLTTQLQNQDPLNPTDTTQFTQQITQMSGVEQQLLSNQLLQQLVSSQGGVSSAANLIGDTITAQSSTASAGAAPISGIVTSVTQSNGETMLNIGSTSVPLSSVTGVTRSVSSSS
jgi:flagellar hook assembly protein FlgD